MEHAATVATAAVLIIVAIAYVAPRMRVAAPVLLVIAGIGLSYIPATPELTLDPEVVLTLILPPILFASAITLPAADFRRNFRAISALAVVLVLVSMFAVGALVHWLLPEIGWAAAIAVGAVVSPPDAVAATSIGKRLGLPPRMVTVLEGEGLVNDATALVALRSAVAAIAGSVSLWGVLGDFLYAVGVGVVTGVVVGLAGLWIRSRLDDAVLTTAVSLVVPFLAFVPAEELNASGVLAVVVTGLITGHGSAAHFSAQARLSERTNWRTIQLLLENGVFLAMGYQMPGLVSDVNSGGGPSAAHTMTIGLAVTAVLIVVRLAFMYPLVRWLRFSEQRPSRDNGSLPPATERPLGLRDGVALGWAGMRGVVTLAAAQTLPRDILHREELVLVAFVVAVTTLVGQGLTLPAVIRWLGVRGASAEAERREFASLAEEIAEVMGRRLYAPDLRQEDGTAFDPLVLQQAREEGARLAARLNSWGGANGPATLDERRDLRRILLDAGQSALLDARASGAYSARAIARFQSILDAEMIRIDAGTAGSS